MAGGRVLLDMAPARPRADLRPPKQDEGMLDRKTASGSDAHERAAAPADRRRSGRRTMVVFRSPRRNHSESVSDMADAAQRVHARLVALAADGADTATLSAAAIADWRAIEAALVPIVGARGFAALFARSLHDTRRTFPWLEWQRNPEPAAGLDQLQQRLASRDSEDILAATTALLQCFCGLLTSLIGAALADRLLSGVASAPDGPAAEEVPR
jgi:hypothetical protein